MKYILIILLFSNISNASYCLNDSKNITDIKNCMKTISDNELKDCLKVRIKASKDWNMTDKIQETEEIIQGCF